MTGAGELRIAVRKFPPFESAIRKQWESFALREHPDASLSITAMGLDQLRDELFPKDGLRNGSWDIAFLVLDWAQAVLEAKSVMNLRPWLERNPPQGFPDGWAPSLLRRQHIGDFIVGLPYHDGPECLIYRRDLFENPWNRDQYRRRFHVELEPPETWDAFHRIARFFQRPDENLSGTCFAAYPDGHNTVYDFLLQLWTRGGEIESGGNLRVDTPEAAEALSFYRDVLNDASAVHPECRQMDSVRSGEAFARGEIAMMVNWFGFAATAEAGADSRVQGRVAIAPIPHGGAGASCSLSTYWLLVIGSGSQHPAIAYDFLRHCASREMDRLLTLEGGIGCRRSTWSDAEVNRRIPFYRDLEKLHASAREMPQTAGWPHASAILDRLVTRAISTDQPIGELLHEADEELRKSSR